MPTLEDIRLGQLAVAQGLAQPLEIEECLAEQHQNEQGGTYDQLGEILVSRGFITRSQLERLLSMQQDAVQKVTRIGAYELIRKLGEGGMGAVYQARDTRTGEIVALKVLPRSKARDNTFLRRFESEARAAFEVDHPNIISGLDVDHADGYHFLVMEYIEGHDIYALLERKGRFPEREALKVVIQISSALDHIHGERLVHRDIKPENILVTPAGVAKLTDMGLMVDKESQGRGRITKVGIAMGTPFYLSPEQIQGKSEIDIRSDIYSLGATAYEMVTGKPPFDGENSTVVMMKHINEFVPSPRDIDRDISLGFCHVLEKMMAKDPAERYQTPAELLLDLKMVAQGQAPLSSRPAEGRSSIARPTGGSHRNGARADSSRRLPKARSGFDLDKVRVGTHEVARPSSSRSGSAIVARSSRRGEEGLRRRTGAHSRYRPDPSLKWFVLLLMAIAATTAIVMLAMHILGGKTQ